jgi:hypothetical protein
MSRNLLKKVVALEDKLWAKATLYPMPSDGEMADFLEATAPLDVPLFNLWANRNPEAVRRDAQQGCILNSLPPTHPAFLPDYSVGYRRHQWGLYYSKAYRDASEASWQRFIAFVRSEFGLTAGKMEIARRLFAEDIGHLTAVQAYVGYPVTHDEIADALTRQWGHVGFARVDLPDGTDDEIWRRGAIAMEKELFGRTVTEAELEAEWAMWRQITEDMKAGRPAGETAAQLRAICEQYPRRVAVGSSEGY